jgi:hypothetical protein
MKVLTTAFLLLSLSVCAQTQTKNRSDLTEDRLRGNVKSVALYSYKIIESGGKPEKGRTIVKSSSKYDEVGNLTEYISSAVSDSVDSVFIHFDATKTIFKYDGEGNLVAKNDYKADGSLDDSSFYIVDPRGSRIDIYTYKADGSLESSSTSEYNLLGNIVESSETVKGKLKSRNTFDYDDKGNETQEIGYGPDGKVKWKEILSYDVNNNLTEVIDYKQDDSFAAKYRYGYDKQGYMAEEDEYHIENSPEHKRTTTRYDSKGHALEINKFNENRRLISQIKLDNMGLHLADIRYNEDGSLQSVVARKYDEWANETLGDRFFTKDSVRQKYRYDYEYDKTGNWIKNTTFKNDKPLQATERKIEYYLNPTIKTPTKAKPKKK